MYSNASDEDLMCLLITLIQFQLWAKAEDLWQYPDGTQPLDGLYYELSKCLSGHTTTMVHYYDGYGPCTKDLAYVQVKCG